MQFSVATLLVLAAVAQAQFIGQHGLGFYNNAYYNGLYNNGLRFNPYSYGYSYNTAAVPVSASPAVLPATYPYSSYTPYAATTGYTSSQYRSQDEFGQASYGYAHPGQAATNYQDAFGNQVGSYAYINPEGEEIRVSYTADANGFRVVSNALPEGPVADLALPVPVQDTPEVIAARQAHLAAVAAAESGVVPVSTLQPVQDTAEVAQAKKEHAEAVEKARAMASDAGSRKKRSFARFHYAPSMTYSTYAHSISPYTVAVAPVPAPVPVREATLTKTVLNPNHAVAYRVD